MTGLNPKRRKFVSEYLKDCNGTQAAIRAGYSPRTANEQAAELLAIPSIRAAVDEKLAALYARNELTVDRVLEEWRRIGFSDLRTFFRDDGNLKSMKELTPEQGAALAGTEVIIKNAAAGDNHQDTVHKIKLHDKVRVLEMMGKRFGLLTERMDHHGEITIRWLE